MNDLTPCGDNRLVCVDCYGYGACCFTIGMVEDYDHAVDLSKALKDTMGIDIEAIKKKFE